MIFSVVSGCSLDSFFEKHFSKYVIILTAYIDLVVEYKLTEAGAAKCYASDLDCYPSPRQENDGAASNPMSFKWLWIVLGMEKESVHDR